MEQLSPGKLLWKRFRGNIPAMLGLMVILLTILLTIFCHLIVPDRTPDASSMCLPIGNRPPGFTVRMLMVRKNVSEHPVGWWSRLAAGRKDLHEPIPVDTVWTEDAMLFYLPYRGDGDRLPIRKLSLADAVWSLDDTYPVRVQGDVVRAVGLEGERYVATSDELFATVLKSQILDKKYWLGTDRYGRDMLSRLVVGTRVTFTVGLIAVLISLGIGVLLGGVAGYFRGGVDRCVLWLINVIWSVPTLLLVISITLVLGKGFMQVFIAVGLTMWVDVARIVRSQLFSVRELDFVSAGKTMGFSAARILFRHMLPNVVGPVLVVAASNFSTAILLEAGLSFLGIGAQPPTPSWGSMIKENYGFIILPQSAYLAILPGLAILLLTLAFTFVANGLRDALDSRKQLLS
ncbi:MAG: ABC transporter permease [Bacteroidota bacterium]